MIDAEMLKDERTVLTVIMVYKSTLSNPVLKISSYLALFSQNDICVSNSVIYHRQYYNPGHLCGPHPALILSLIDNSLTGSLYMHSTCLFFIKKYFKVSQAGLVN